MNDRLTALAATLKEGEAALILSPSNRLYYTGFNTDNGALWVTREEACFLTDSRYIEAAHRVIADIPCRCSHGLFADTAASLKRRKVATVFVEDSLTIAEHRRMIRVFEGIDIECDGTLRRYIDGCRATKSAAEIARIRRAQAITEAGFEYILPRIAVGRTEKDVALELEMYMRQHGADSVAFDFIVASGENSALPHAVPSDRRIRRGDFVTMDFGATVDGYRSDMTRTVAVGEIDDEQRRVYDTVLTAQTTCLAGLHAGMTGEAGDALARDVIVAAGYGEAFGHSTGHSVGIDIHESPNLSPREVTRLPEGCVVTVEPGIYLEGRFGVRIEDMVVLTADGCENLTNSPKDLIIL